jgi:hypothetical protein
MTAIQKNTNEAVARLFSASTLVRMGLVDEAMVMFRAAVTNVDIIGDLMDRVVELQDLEK